jgi:nitroreductase
MDTYEAITKKLDVRDFASEQVGRDIKRKILEAARLTASSMNKQHWRFILVQEPANLKKLAADSTTGKWVERANFAIIILTDPKVHGHSIAAWNFGVASGIYLGVNEAALRKDFGIPQDLEISALLGFGYPKNKILGKKDRKPLEEIAFSERYGQKIRP